MSKVGMATDHKSQVLAAASAAPIGAQHEEEVYGMLGALLGTLEVVATDESSPLTNLQAQRMESAVQLCHSLERRVEALLTLATDDLGQRLRRRPALVRPLVEHATRGALRAVALRAVQLHLPEPREWGEQRVSIDVSRVDRMLQTLVEALALSVGQGGSISVLVQSEQQHVRLTLRGAVGAAPTDRPRTALPALSSATLLLRGATRLCELHGGQLEPDFSQLTIHVSLPVAEDP